MLQQQFKNHSGRLFYALGIGLLWWWNWKLLLATVGGMGLMLLAYSLQTNHWQQSWFKWQRFLTGSQGKLAIAVGTGGIGAFTTYLATSIWADTENRWLATGLILQGLGTFITVGLLIWQISSHRAIATITKFEQLLADLTASDSLKRLIAIHRLTRLARHHRLSSAEESQLKEYFCLMLSQSEDMTIKQALLDSLEQLGINLFKAKEKSALQIPIQLQASAKPIYHNK
ncbi:ATP synthase subunit I [Stanieria cyanosphaera]|nr:ATP synthase subunit I [Stanieria cyanosphaera]